MDKRKVKNINRILFGFIMFFFLYGISHSNFNIDKIYPTMINHFEKTIISNDDETIHFVSNMPFSMFTEARKVDRKEKTKTKFIVYYNENDRVNSYRRSLGWGGETLYFFGPHHKLSEYNQSVLDALQSMFWLMLVISTFISIITLSQLSIVSNLALIHIFLIQLFIIISTSFIINISLHVGWFFFSIVTAFLLYGVLYGGYTFDVLDEYGKKQNIITKLKERYMSNYRSIKNNK